MTLALLTKYTNGLSTKGWTRRIGIRDAVDAKGTEGPQPVVRIVAIAQVETGDFEAEGAGQGIRSERRRAEGAQREGQQQGCGPFRRAGCSSS